MGFLRWRKTKWRTAHPDGVARSTPPSMGLGFAGRRRVKSSGETHRATTTRTPPGNNRIYYITTNEIPGELSRENLIAELSRAKRASGAPWVRKWSNLPIRENLVITWPYTDRPPARASVRPSAPRAYQCKITQSTGMATQMQLAVILAGNRIATDVL